MFPALSCQQAWGHVGELAVALNHSSEERDHDLFFAVGQNCVDHKTG